MFSLITKFKYHLLILCLVQYLLLTQSHDFSWGESPLLVSSSFQLGGAHPPGYPFFVNSLHIMKFLPIGDYPFRANLFGFLCAAFAVTALLILLLHLTRNAVFISLTGSCILFASLPFQSGIQGVEVYGLNILFILIVVLLQVKQPHPRSYLIMSFVAGLALTHHITFFLFLLPTFIFYYLGQRTSNQIRSASIILFLLGLSVDLLLVFRDFAHPLIVWGHASHYMGFIRLVSAIEESVGSMQAGTVGSLTGMLSRGWTTFLPTLVSIGGIGLIFAVRGVAVLWQQSRALCLTFSSSIFLFFTGISIYETRESISFFLPATCLLLILFVVGLSKSYPDTPGFVLNRLRGLPSLFLIVLLVLNFFLSWGTRTSDSMYPRLFISHLLDSSSDQSVILTKRSDVSFACSYLIRVERRYSPKERFCIFQHLTSFEWYLRDLKQNGLDSISTESFSQIPEDTHGWNAVITNRIVRGNLDRHEFKLTDYSTIMDIKMVSSEPLCILPFQQFAVVMLRPYHLPPLAVSSNFGRLDTASRRNIGYQLDQASRFYEDAGKIEQAEKFRYSSRLLWETYESKTKLLPFLGID